MKTRLILAKGRAFCLKVAGVTRAAQFARSQRPMCPRAFKRVKLPGLADQIRIKKKLYFVCKLNESDLLDLNQRS